MTGLRRACLPVIALVLSSAQAFAQEAVVEAGTSVGAIHTDAHVDSRDKVRDWKYWGLAAGLNGAMLVDTKSTFDVLRDCRQACREANPVVAPFVRRGPAVAYAAGMLCRRGGHDGGGEDEGFASRLGAPNLVGGASGLDRRPLDRRAPQRQSPEVGLRLFNFPGFHVEWDEPSHSRRRQAHGTALQPDAG